MSESKNQIPIYDDRVKATLKGLAKGKTREELAQGFGLNSWKSLDVYLRRKFFTWDSSNGTYIPAVNRMDNILEEVESNIPIKAEQIMRKFEEYGDHADPRLISQEFGFDDHNEMAEYMGENNIVFSVDDGNYMEKHKMDNDTAAINTPKDKPDLIRNNSNGKVLASGRSKSASSKDMSDLNDEDVAELLTHLPMLRLLEEHKDILLDLLMVSSEGKIPTYGVPGTPGTKSIYMSNLLSRLMADFSKTKNLSQREIVEASIIEYLKRYGYRLEVEKLLSKR